MWKDRFNHLKPLNILILFKVSTNLIPSGQLASSLDFSPYLNKPQRHRLEPGRLDGLQGPGKDGLYSR